MQLEKKANEAQKAINLSFILWFI